MSLLDRAEELKDVSDAQLAQLVKQGSEAGDTWLAATETERRLGMRNRYAAELTKNQAKQAGQLPPENILAQRVNELDVGITRADPNTQGPNPSLRTGIATAAGGGLIRGYQQGAGIGDPDEIHRQLIREMIDRESGMTQRERAKAEGPEALAAFERRHGPEEGEFYPWLEGSYLQGGTEEEQAEGRERMRHERVLRETRSLEEKAAEVGLTPTEYAARVGVGGGGLEELAQSRLERFERPTGELPDELQPHPDDTPQEAEEKRRWREKIVGEDTTYLEGRAEDAALMARGLPPLTQAQAAGDPDDDLAFLESLRIRGGSGSGLPTLAETYDEGRKHIRDYQALMGESDEDLEYDQLRREAAAKESWQARGIHSLQQERRKEEERLLAERLGISEDRIAEFMREMDTPEDIKNRRESAGWGGLSSMFLSPDLATGISGVGERIRGIDDTLREERKTALGDIFDERVAGADLESLKRKGIFDSTIQSQKDWDKADLAMQNMESTIAKERAARGRAGQEQAMKSFIDLLKNQAQHIGAWDATMAQITAQMQEATVNRDNPMMQAEAWEKIEMGLDDWVNRITDGPDGPEYKMWQRAVKVKDAALGTLIIKSGESIVEDDQGVGVPTSRRTDQFTVPNFSFSSSPP